MLRQSVLSLIVRNGSVLCGKELVTAATPRYFSVQRTCLAGECGILYKYIFAIIS